MMVNYKEPTDRKFDDYKSQILTNLAAGDSSDSECDAVDGQYQTKKLLNMKLRHVGITAIKQRLEFPYFIDSIQY